MRFISKYGSYKIMAVHDETERLADGSQKLVDKGYVCEFQHGGLTEAEREFARRHFVWKGTPTAVNGAPLDPVRDLHRVSVFDTAWAPESLRDRVEQALLKNAALGQDFVQVETVRLPAPWPAYDRLVAQGRRTVEMVAEKIVERVREDGYDPAAVLDYERENLNRPAVVAALEALVVGDPEPDLIAA